MIIDWDDMDHLSKLTLVVPTFNRPKDVMRLMRFWADSPVQIHIMDGSSNPLDETFVNSLDGNIHYHHMPVSIQERMKKSIELIDTPYVDTLCDDEFYIPSAIDNCIHFLENNREYVSCTGTCIGFMPTNKGIKAKKFHTLMYHGYGCFEDDTRDRMINHMDPYVGSNIYAIQRSDVWCKSIDVLSSFVFSTPYVHEFQLELTTLLQGKSKVLDELMWLRNTNNKPVNIREHNRSLQFDVWFKKYTSEVQHFYDSIADKFGKTEEQKIEIKNSLKLALNAQLNWYSRKNRLHLATETLYNRFMGFVSVSSDMMRRIRAFRISFEWKPIMDVATGIAEEGTRVDMDQLWEIKKVIA